MATHTQSRFVCNCLAVLFYLSTSMSVVMGHEPRPPCETDVSHPQVFWPIQWNGQQHSPQTLVIPQSDPLAPPMIVRFHSRPFDPPTRLSDRKAEIWLKFPDGRIPTVRMNFTEYPAEGNFRVFRTTVLDPSPRRYYIEADGFQPNSAVDVSNHMPQCLGSLEGLRYINLNPGQTIIVSFVRTACCIEAAAPAMSFEEHYRTYRPGGEEFPEPPPEPGRQQFFAPPAPTEPDPDQ